MTEKLLQYLWRFQYFNRSELTTSQGDSLQIIHPGLFNQNQGPDFTNAQIRIGNTTFHGSVELHLATSQWNLHGHSTDHNYGNVVLHVVYQNDLPAPVADIPVLELQHRIPYHLLQKYEQMMHTSGLLPCRDSIHKVTAIVWAGWKERLLAERLTRKAQGILSRLEQSNYHWEETFWWMLARNFGANVNNDVFEAMARTIPVKTLARHKQSIHQLEALMFGQIGLLEDTFEEDYPKLLQREYQFLAKKYQLKPIHLPVHFLRMRPGNFPTIRIAQLAALIQSSEYLFSKVLEASAPQALMKNWDVAANDYWHYHYRFGQESAFKVKNLGRNMMVNLVINTIVPTLFAYGLYHKLEACKQKALDWLEALPAECNTIIREFDQLDISSKSAFDTQSLIELKNQYCSEKKCLQCAAGNAILKQEVRKNVS